MKNNNPIQVVFNSSDYIYKPIVTPGGSKTDFYEDRDQDYIDHKQALLRQTENVMSSLLATQSRVGVVKVELNPLALAKSHRPVRCLFQEDKSPLIGGLGIGQLLFQVSASSLEWLREKIEDSEEYTNRVFDRKTKKLVVNPSSAKSETGAIDKILFFGPEEKASFSAQESIHWLKKENVAKGYIVELIQFSQISRRNFEFDHEDISRMKVDLSKRLHLLGAGVLVSRISRSDESSSLLYVRLLKPSTGITTIDFDNAVLDRQHNTENDFDFSVERHELLIKILRNSQLIRRISLPPELSSSDFSSALAENEIELPTRILTADYPKVGVIDSGIKNEYIQEWCINSSRGFDPNDCDPHHGSQVASLLVAGKALNPHLAGIEEDGCLIYDIWMPIHNEKNQFFSYFDGYGDFFDWLDYEVGLASKKGVRILNLSMNFKEYVRDDSYSFAASQIDRISKKYNVIFVISAGNLAALDFRALWPSGTALLSDVDRLSQPSEAITAITVGAINPPGCDRNLHGAPTVYTRRGPGVSMGVKPDVVHYGGFVQKSSSKTGLTSLNGVGQIVQECGTSFSAPLVSKALAALDHRTKNSLSRNSLLAMLIHHCHFPDPLKSKSVSSSVRRRYVGFGTPSTSDEALVTDDYAITLLFEGNLKRGEVVEFDFSWPGSLFDKGKCFGEVTLTLVYDTVTNPKFGGEYCRVNIDAALQQEKYITGDEKWAYRKNCNSIWEDKVGQDVNYEKNQIEHGLKWWPVKKYHREIKRGVGKSQNWRLRIDSVERSGGDYPISGIEFCAILTIQDPNKKSANLFNEVKQELTAIGVEIKSIHVTQDITIQSEQ